MTPTKIGNVVSWASEVEDQAMEQAQRSSRLPFVDGHVALMPDAHWGMGATIGSVIPTSGAIVPACVGVDLGCGMIAQKTTLTADDLPDSLEPLLSLLEQAIPAGMGKGHGHRDTPHALARLGTPDKRGGSTFGFVDNDRAEAQFGTLGGGNHFVEVCLDETSTVWIVLHSGSRGIGNRLAQAHINTAKGLMRKYFIELEDPDLAYLVEGTPEFDHYIADMLWAQDYALANREAMLNAAVDCLATATARTTKEIDGSSWPIQSHHNFTVREHHYGKNVWVTRKGAVKAAAGDMGILPGSMATGTFIVRGLGNPASYNSCAHGAGRRMSRTAARKNLTADSLREAMKGKAWLENDADALLDEHPDAYKDVETVMRDQSDLVEPVHVLHQVLNLKGVDDNPRRRKS